MQIAYNEEQTLLKQAVERYVEARYGLAQRRRFRAEPAGYSRENWQGLAELGILGLIFGGDEGGLGGGARDLTAVMEAMGAGLVVEPLLEEVIVAANVLAKLGSPSHRNEWLPKVIDGEAHLALAHFEHSARFNLADVRARAQLRDGTWFLSGEKSPVMFAAAADLWIVSARDDGTHEGIDGIGFYLVSPRTDGVERRDFRLIDGGSASSIRFRGCAAAARLPGRFEAFSRCVDFARLAAGAEMVGIMSTLLHSTLDYLRARKQFGAPLSSFQALQHRLARLYVQLEQSRSHIARAALFVDHGANSPVSLAGMKSYVGRTAIDMGEACVHLHGGMGMSDELALGYGFKRLLVLSRLFGDPDVELSRYAQLCSPLAERESRVCET